MKKEKFKKLYIPGIILIILGIILLLISFESLAIIGAPMVGVGIGFIVLYFINRKK